MRSCRWNGLPSWSASHIALMTAGGGDAPRLLGEGGSGAGMARVSGTRARVGRRAMLRAKSTVPLFRVHLLVLLQVLARPVLNASWWLLAVTMVVDPMLIADDMDKASSNTEGMRFECTNGDYMAEAE